MADCSEMFQKRLTTILNLREDIKGEIQAYETYTKHLDYIFDNLIEPSIHKNFVGERFHGDDAQKLYEIRDEEKHHLEELTAMLQQDWFKIERAIAEFADCECGRGITQADREQARVSAPSYKVHPKR